MFIHPSDVLAKPTETWLSSTLRSRQFRVCLFLNSLINVFRANITQREWGIGSSLSLVNSSLAAVTMESCPESLPSFTPLDASLSVQHLLLIETQRRDSPELTAFQFAVNLLFCLCVHVCFCLLNFCVGRAHVTWSGRVTVRHVTHRSTVATLKLC